MTSTWSLVALVVAITLQALIARSMREPHRSIYMAMSRSNLLILIVALSIFAVAKVMP